MPSQHFAAWPQLPATSQEARKGNCESQGTAIFKCPAWKQTRGYFVLSTHWLTLLGMSTESTEPRVPNRISEYRVPSSEYRVPNQVPNHINVKGAQI